ncbi:MAG: aminopeptidase P family protein [Prevotella sp.]|nr:aminopeptidase P family protein [Prevotella sp.]
MENTVVQRIEKLRQWMRTEHLGAVIIPSGDPHNSEYVADRWKGREWISGFDGSAGTAVVTMKDAALWTDSRYFIAAASQLSGTEYMLMKDGLPETPTIAEWLGQQLYDEREKEVAIDGTVVAAAAAEELKIELRRAGGLTLRTNADPLKHVWDNRPGIPDGVIAVHPMEYAGERSSEKIKRIRRALRERHADGMLVAALDDIAWTLNLRGNDVLCTPVFVAYLLIASQKVTLFVNGNKLTNEAREYLASEGVDTDEYENVAKALRQYGEYNILMDRNEINCYLMRQAQCDVVEDESPIDGLKVVKNSTEIAGFREAMLRDGVAMVKFLRWIDTAVPQGGQTELSISRKLESLRREQKLYKGPSFDTIAAYAEHGAIVHYEPTEASDLSLQPKGLLLVDSGGQYLDGTTDITRTIALGPVTREEQVAYTAVLKAHIQLELLKFPEGASGTQLDAVARKELWKEGLNYLHGTGHGVGSYLSVHEGKHQIRMQWKPAPMRAGMTVTDEPGVYVEGRFGVRIENTLIVVPYKTTEMGTFLQFDSLTLCPIDLRPVIVEMLTTEERTWLNSYHKHVYDQLAPFLDTEDRSWLAENTRFLPVG